MSSPQSNPKNFDVVALCREFREEVVPKKQRPLNISWERECRPILIDAAINDLETSVVLEFLQKHQVPFPKSPEAAERTMQQWLARIRKEIHLPSLPSGAKRSSPGYQEGLRRWKKTNPIPTVEEIIAGWQAKPVDYSDLNFFSLLDAYAPRTPKSKKPQATLPTPVEDPILARTVLPGSKKNNPPQPAGLPITPTSGFLGDVERIRSTIAPEHTTEESIADALSNLAVNAIYPAHVIALRTLQSQLFENRSKLSRHEIRQHFTAIEREMERAEIEWKPPF